MQHPFDERHPVEQLGSHLADERANDHRILARGEHGELAARQLGVGRMALAHQRAQIGHSGGCHRDGVLPPRRDPGSIGPPLGGFYSLARA